MHWDGFVGLFGYVFGEVIASYIIGLLVDQLGWKASFFTIIIAAIVSIICFIIFLKKIPIKSNLFIIF